MSEFSYPETRVASVAATNAEGKVLFGLRRDHGLWTLPGGHLDDGEAPVRGAVRELLEETNLTPVEITFLGEGLVEAEGKTLRIFCYKMVVEGEPSSVNDPDEECSTWVWVDCVDGIPANIFDHLYSPNNVTLKYCGLQRGVIVDDSYDTIRRDSSQMAELQKSFDPNTHPRDENGKFIATDAIGHENDPDEPLSEGREATDDELFGQALQSVNILKKFNKMPAKKEELIEMLGAEWPSEVSKQQKVLEVAGFLGKAEPVQHPDAALSDIAQHIKLQLMMEHRGQSKGKHPSLNEFHKNYKNAPHSEDAQMLKYIIHRIENKDHYDKDPGVMDDFFDGANATASQWAKKEPKHGVVKRLAEKLHRNPHLIDQALEHQKQVHAVMLPKAIPVNGEPHVALARYLDAEPVGNARKPDPVLSSYSHKLSKDGIFKGKRPYKHLVPLKHVWASYDLLPPEASKYKGGVNRQVGTQHEVLVSPHPLKPATEKHFEDQGALVPSMPKEHIQRLAASELEELWDALVKEEEQHALALASIKRMKPEHQSMATDWYHYTQGHTDQRPQITPALERHMAKFGVVDPAGYPYTETGMDMQKPIGGKKVFNKQPDALREYKQNTNFADYNLPFQRSEELAKFKPSPTFPKLGVKDNRRETLLATRPQAELQNKLAMHNAYQTQHFNPEHAQTVRTPHIFGESPDTRHGREEKNYNELFQRGQPGAKSPKGNFVNQEYKNDMRQTKRMTDNVHGASSTMKPTIASYALQNKDRKDKGLERQSDKSDLATVLHEDFHNVINRARMRYGHQGVANLTQNLMTHLKGKDERAYHQLHDYFKTRTGMEPDDRGYNEEHIAHLINYLNDPGIRKNYLRNSTDWIDSENRPQAARAIDQRMKSAYRHIVHGALTADKTWVLDPKHKALLDKHKKQNAHITTPADHVDKSEGYYDTSSDTEMELSKGLKGAIAGAMMLGAAAHAGSPAPKTPHAQHTATTQQQPSWNKEGLHYEMYPIGKLESNNGTMLNHEPSKNGPSHTAYGPLGFKPSSAFEEFQTSPRLKAKYQGNETADKFLKTFQSNPTMYNEIASHHWNRLKKLAGGQPHRAAYGWRWGPGKLQTATTEEIDADPYVQKYKDMLQPQVAMMKFAHEATRLYKANREANWKGGDISIPKTGTPDRTDYDKKYVRQLKNVFGQGGHTLKRLVVPTANINAFSGNMPVNKERLNLYHKMARGGDRLPPIVVRRHSNNLFDIVDGSHRYAAAMRAGLPNLEAYELIHPLNKTELDAKRVPKRYVGEFNGLSVYLVDGAFIRNNVDIEYTEGGNHERYNWVPPEEIWLEDTGNEEDISACAVHEYYELTLMGHGMSYDQAHDKASAVEKKFRTEHEGEPVLLPDAVQWYDKHVEE